MLEEKMAVLNLEAALNELLHSIHRLERQEMARADELETLYPALQYLPLHFWPSGYLL